MIKTFRNRALSDLWATERSAKIDVRFHERILIRLDALDQAVLPEDLNISGFDFHALRGKPKRYSVHVNGPWCITFEFENGDAFRVDFGQYH